MGLFVNEKVTDKINLANAPIILVGSSVRAAAQSVRLSEQAVRLSDQGETRQLVAIDQYGDRETRQASDLWFSLQAIQRQPKLLASAGVSPGAKLQIVGGMSMGYRWLEQLGYSFRGATPECHWIVAEYKWMSDVAREAGAEIPETTLSAPHDNSSCLWLTKASLPDGQPSSGGLGVRWWSAKAIEVADTPLVYQKFVPGKTFGASYWIGDGRARLLGVCRAIRKRIGDLPFVYGGSMGPVACSQPVQNILTRLGAACAHRLPWSGPLNIDFVIDSSSGTERVTLLEINPRYSASMEVLEIDWRLKTKRSVSFLKGDELPSRPAVKEGVLVKRVLFARESQRVVPEKLDEKYRGTKWQLLDVPNKAIEIGKHEPIATLMGAFR